MYRLIILFLLASVPFFTRAQFQYPGKLSVKVLNDQQVLLPHATVELLRQEDSALVKAGITDSSGLAVFDNLPAGDYIFRVTNIQYTVQYSSILHITTDNADVPLVSMVLQPASSVLNSVTVTARKPLVQFFPDKTVVNVDAGITNAGATALEVLEKSPGITVDRNGTIHLKGREGVLIMLDGKPTYMSGADLVNMLNGMSASQLEQVEIMDNPPAKYDAAGNAGIINIITKKNRQRGFNGNLTLAYGQGVYPKNNNSLLLNYRTGNVNFFLTYSVNVSRYFLDMYALRTYFKPDNKTVDAILEQPFNNKGRGYTHNLRTGMDYFISPKTTVGFSLTGVSLYRHSNLYSNAQWLTEAGVVDSVIHTNSNNNTRWKNGGGNINLRHTFNKQQELSVDVDYLTYRINSDQYFKNTLSGPGGYEEALRGDLPARIKIMAGKADYTERFGSSFKLETGWKSSHVTTDNIAEYYTLQNGSWEADLGKTNHFKYAESIHAAYASLEKQAGVLTVQAGLRYEYTHYDANQLGNAARKDSSFTREYNSLFPTAFLHYKVDSVNSLTLSAGRRIDRPAFHKLNPFVFVINKYTNQEGNPYFLPQYTWNVELSHQYKSFLVTGISYSITRDYFSQIFLSDTTTGKAIYTEGNIGRMENFGLSVSLNLPLFNWWSLSAQATANHKKIKGFIWNNYAASITQMNASINNQFRFHKGWSAELTAFYISRNQNDIQEVLYPTGQISAGVAKQVFKNKGSLKLTLRDMIYSQTMEGLTDFEQFDEYFKLKRDTRILTLAFSWRFGKPFKTINRRSGGAGDEIQRVGSNG